MLLLSSGVSFAQKGSWTIGLASGIRGDVTQSAKVQHDYKFGNQLSSPPLELNLTYDINNNFSATIGIAYLEYQANWKSYYTKSGKTTYKPNYDMMYKTAQIPLNIKYHIPLGNSDFRFFGKLGLTLDIIADILASHPTLTPKVIDIDGKEYVYSSPYYTTVYNKKINCLINAGVGFAYRLKNGLGFSIVGEYYTGTRIMGEVLIKNTLSDMDTRLVIKEYEELLLVKGDYWNVGFGISYTFKKKDKTN
jgi:hypothetical protein